MVALERAGIPIEKYYASEIDEYAMKISNKNYPEIIQLGDIRNVSEEVLDSIMPIDMIIGGSPCQDLSNYKYDRGEVTGLNGEKSGLFYEYIRILKYVKPKYFLLENVASMEDKWKDLMSEIIGVQPIMINSALVCAAERKRLYWTNIPNIQQPVDKGIELKDILEDVSFEHPAAIRGRNIDLNKATIVGRRLNQNGHREDYNKKIPITQCLEVRATNTNKSNCLTTVDKDNVLTPLPIGRYPDVFNKNLPFRYYTTKEMCRLQTLPDNYLDMIPNTAARKALGNGWTVDVIAHILRNIPEKDR